MIRPGHLTQHVASLHIVLIKISFSCLLALAVVTRSCRFVLALPGCVPCAPVPLHPSSPSGIRMLLALGRYLTHSSAPPFNQYLTEVKYFYDSSSPGDFPGVLAVLFFLEGKADKQALLSLLWGDAEECD